MNILNQQELINAVATIEGWQIIDEAIEKKFTFKDFKKALAFIIEIGILAEQADHHPEIWNVYNVVKIRLNTHSVKGITMKDIELAKAINVI